MIGYIREQVRFLDAAVAEIEHGRVAAASQVRTTRFGRDSLVGRAAGYAAFHPAVGWGGGASPALDVIIAMTYP